MTEGEKLAALLAEQLRGFGFAPARNRHQLTTAEAGMTSGLYGITVHVDPDCVRLIYDACGVEPAYRLLIPRHVGISAAQAVTLGCRLVRREICDRRQ